MTVNNELEEGKGLYLSATISQMLILNRKKNFSTKMQTIISPSFYFLRSFFL